MKISIIDGFMTPQGPNIKGQYIFDDEGLLRCEIHLDDKVKVGWDRTEGGECPLIPPVITEKFTKARLKASGADALVKSTLVVA